MSQSNKREDTILKVISQPLKLCRTVHRQQCKSYLTFKARQCQLCLVTVQIEILSLRKIGVKSRNYNVNLYKRSNYCYFY